MTILKISGVGNYSELGQAIDESGIPLEHRTYSQGFGTSVTFIIDASRGIEQARVEELLKSAGMQISSSVIEEGTVPVDSDAFDD